MAYRTDQTLSSTLLGTEVQVALGSSTNKSHQDFRVLLTSLPQLKSNQYFVFFIRNHKATAQSISNLNAATRVIWKTLVETWRGDDTLARKVDANLPTILTNSSLKLILEKHLEIQDLIQAVSYSKHYPITKTVGGIKFTFMQSLVHCQSRHEECSMTYNHFLAYADTLRSMVHLMVVALVEDITGKYLQSQEGTWSAFIQTTDGLALKTDHDTYFQAIKSIYPYAQGRVLHHHNKMITDDFWKITHKNVAILGAEFLQHLDIFAMDHLVQCLEVYSVQKCFFYPEIDLKSGVEQQFNRMRKENSDAQGQHDAGQDLLYMFRKEYTRGYVQKHGKWPNCSISEAAHPQIKYLKALNEWPSNNSVPYYYFKNVVLEYQGEPLQFEPDLSDIVTDKAIIESREHWTYEFNTRAHNDKHGSRLKHLKETPGDKRLIKAMLSGKLENIKELLEPYVDGNVNTTSLVTVLVPKEKELKVKGCFFSK